MTEEDSDKDSSSTESNEETLEAKNIENETDVVVDKAVVEDAVVNYAHREPDNQKVPSADEQSIPNSVDEDASSSTTDSDSADTDSADSDSSDSSE